MGRSPIFIGSAFQKYYEVRPFDSWGRIWLIHKRQHRATFKGDLRAVVTVRVVDTKVTKAIQDEKEGKMLDMRADASLKRK